MQRGELKRRLTNQHLWNEGSVPKQYQQDEEETVQIHIITLRAYLSELATVRALDEGIDDFGKLTARVDELLMTELNDAKEFVEVNDNFIRVGINCRLIDDNAVLQAFEMVGKLNSLKPGTMIEIGQLVHIYESKIERIKRTN
jgi:hypothetical protein